MFESDRLEPYMRKNVGYEQLFIGREGTGTPFHHAANFNFFYNIHGKKRWYFVDPYDTFLMYPTMVLGRAANMSLCLYPDEYNKNAFPLFEYCPVYTAELNPGDVFIPSSFLHIILLLLFIFKFKIILFVCYFIIYFNIFFFMI